MKRASAQRWRAALLVPALAGAFTLSGPAAADLQSVDDLRRAFSAAYEAESRGHHAEALAMFRVVRASRDTASVRYRIAACLAALGKLTQARAMYLSVPEVARPGDTEVVASAQSNAALLAGRLAELSVTVTPAREPEATLPHPPAPVTVTLDGEPVPLVGGVGSLTADPGAHELVATRGDEPAVRLRVTLVAGHATAVVIGLSGPVVEAHAAPAASAALGTTNTTSLARPAGAAAVGLGVALLVVGGVALLVRDAAIRTVEETCPAGVCPRAKADTVDAAAGRARAMLPVGVVCGVTGVLALGAGTWLLLRPDRSSDGQLAGLSASVGGRF